MKLKEAYETYKNFKVPSLLKIRNTASEHSKTSLVIIILLGILLLLALQYLPHLQVAQFNITNQKDLADAENSYRVTLVQIFGGVAIAIGIYFAWGNLKTAREGQITERFTRAVDQLGAIDTDGNPAIEIRLGGIYALERIANESDQDYWPIMEILTAYVRKNSPIENNEIQMEDNNNRKKLSLDIQTILSVIGRRKYTTIKNASDIIDLQKTYLQEADIPNSNLKTVYLSQADLGGANLSGANLEGAYLGDAKLNGALLIKAYLGDANLEGADFQGAFLNDANFEKADLKKAKNIASYRLCKVKTLYKAELEPELEKELRAKGFGHLLDVEPER